MSMSLTSCPKEDIVNRIRNWRTLLVTGLLGIVALSAFSANALWSDVQSVEGNKVQAGTISIDLRGAVNKPLMDSVVSGDVLHGVGGLLPGESTAVGKIEIYNDGTRAQKQYIKVSNPVGDLCSYVTITLGRNTNSDNVSFNETIGTFTLSELANYVEVGRNDGSGSVPDNNTTVLVQKANLIHSTPDSFNGTGATCVWTEDFKGEQVAP